MRLGQVWPIVVGAVTSTGQITRRRRGVFERLALGRIPYNQPHAWALLAITIVAAALRYWHLQSLPPGYWFDEAHKSLAALAISRGEQAPLYITEYQGIEAGYAWLLAGWFKLFGPSFFATRALSAALGTLTVPVTYWAVQRLYRESARARRLALVSAAWLSVLLWHVHWSRAGMETILVPLFAVALAGLVAWAWERPTYWSFGLAGAALGLSQYTNPGARVLPLEALLVFALLARGPWRSRLAYGLAFLIAALVVYLPLGLFFIQQPQWFLNRIASTSEGARQGGWHAYALNALQTLLSFNFRGDALPRHNLSGRPALDAAASLCMAVGVAALWVWRKVWRRHLVVLSALGVNLLPMVFSDGAPGFGRTLGATPFLVVLPALGWVLLSEQLPARRSGLVLATGCLAVSAALNVYAYFWQFPRQPNLFDAYEVGQWRLLQAAWQGSRSGTGYLIVNGATAVHPAVKLAERLATGDLRVVNAQACRAYPNQSQSWTTIAAQAEWMPALRRRFPGATAEEILHEPQVYLYGSILRLPPGPSAESSHGWANLGDSTILLSTEVAALEAAAGDTVTVPLRWLVLRPMAVDYHVFVHLAGGQAPWLAGADGEPCQGWYGTSRWHTGEIVEHSMRLALPPDLLPGTYDLAAGLYNWVTGERLSVVQDGGREPDRAFIGRVVVK